METLPKKKTAHGRISAMHVIVVTLSIMMTVGVWLFSERQIETRIKSRFELSRDRALDLIVDRMGQYEDALWAGVSAVESHGGDMSLEEWRIFANTLRIEEKYPGINGIGIIHYLNQEDIPSYMEQRLRERESYRVHPPHDEEIQMPISFIEPEAVNAAAVGLDVAHEQNRRMAALASRDTGESQITGPIVLVQDEGSTPGFLFYAPYYEGGPRDTVAERRESILGIVYAPFVVRKLMEGLLAKDLREVRFSIRDGDELIYDEHSADDGLNDPDPMHSETVELNLYGRVWTLDMRTNLAFRANNTFAQPTVILLAGLLIEALIISLLVMMSRANRQAIAYADKVTAELRAERNKLEETNARLIKSNDELEQFAYVTSHDLKTPVRGIGSLTEMVKEDLEDYLASPDANPDVQNNLDHIIERVGRMNALIGGILEFSRVGRRVPSEAALDLEKIIEDLRSDLSLRKEQLILTGSADTVSYDSQMFRSVLENLVSNAVRYHPEESKAEIIVKVEMLDDRYRVAVSDNGKGIDPRYHSKIFGVFQTLREAGTPESTGVGLAIVKKAVEQHGFSVSVDSSPGSGTVFRFDWPKQARNNSN
ncbi:MAG: histidine kinase [Rhodobacteraceae bacterium]|nr:histidine kinase [Paracoccaceae bacterium]